MGVYSVDRLSESVTLHRFEDARFKTMKVSVHMIVPLREETAALYGILPGLVIRATREYPTFSALNRRLSELYGSSLSAGSRKIGGYQCLSFAVGGIASPFAFDGDDMIRELTELLFSALFHPLKDSLGQFPLENFLQEQRQLLELKDAEFNDKISYAHQRCEEILFEGSPAALDRYGSREQIQALDRAAVTAAWEKLLSSARIEIFALGNFQAAPSFFADPFRRVGHPVSIGPLPFAGPEKVVRRVEEQPVTQSKLALGFRVNADPAQRLRFRLMSAVLGGVPSSKLFRNVREKMSLCYYCSSSFSPVARALFIESGVETPNLDRAETEILRQLEDLRKGDLQEDELQAAKLALCNSFRSVGDSLAAVQNWYLAQLFLGIRQSPEEAAREILGITGEDVVEAAGMLMPASAYTLKGGEGN